jgi:hypothetical protein
MSDEEIRLECLKQAASDERIDRSVSDVIARATRYAGFVLGRDKIGTISDGPRART